MLAERIKQALGVLAEHGQSAGTMRKQATAYLGEQVDDRCIDYFAVTAGVVYSETVAAAVGHGHSPGAAHKAGVCNVLVAGMAIGKRLGIEDGERFARQIEGLDVSDA